MNHALALPSLALAAVLTFGLGLLLALRTTCLRGMGLRPMSDLSRATGPTARGIQHPARPLSASLRSLHLRAVTVRLHKRGPSSRGALPAHAWPSSSLINLLSLIKRGVFFPALLVSASASHAGLPQPVLNAISNAGIALLTAISSVIGVMVVFWGINKLAYKLGFGGVPDVGERYAYYDKNGRLIEASWTKRDDGIHKRRHGN